MKKISELFMDGVIFNVILGVHKVAAPIGNHQEYHTELLWQVEITNSQTSNEEIVEVSKIFNMSLYHISNVKIKIGN